MGVAFLGVYVMREIPKFVQEKAETITEQANGEMVRVSRDVLTAVFVKEMERNGWKFVSASKGIEREAETVMVFKA